MKGRIGTAAGSKSVLARPQKHAAGSLVEKTVKNGEISVRQHEMTETSGAVASLTRVLLLGDDGRMAAFLRGKLANWQVEAETNVLAGIARLGNSAYDAMLLNVGRLEHKTADVAKALRRLGGTIPVLLYGEAYTEVYAQAALAAGAKDFLAWPIPVKELKRHLDGAAHADAAEPHKRTAVATTPLSTAAVQEPHPPASLLRVYQSLAELVPQGRETLIAQSEQVLAEALTLEWVKVLPTEKNHHSDQTDLDTEPQANDRLPLPGPLGTEGEMLLGPALAGCDTESPTAAREAAAFLGTLLHLVRREESLKQLATVDELTGAYNRRYVMHFLNQVLQQSKHEHTEVTLLLFDVDEFKHYNDTYGHGAGDTILKQAIELMRWCCRSHDVVARMGGDEFAVVFWDTGKPRPVYEHSPVRPGDEPVPPDEGAADGQDHAKPLSPRRTHPELAMFMSNRFRKTMMTSQFEALGAEAQGVLTISGGLASFPWDGGSAEELLAKADEALLAAKRSGKNRIYLVGDPHRKRTDS